MPPPMINLSHFSKREFRTSIFVDTLEPPTTAAIGLAPFTIAPSKYFSSLARRNPDTDVVIKCVTPSVDAWARWADPKASFTYTSKGAESSFAKTGSFLDSSLWKRVFSSRITSPSFALEMIQDTSAPIQSGASKTDWPSSSPRRTAQGFSEYFFSGPFFGRPRST